MFIKIYVSENIFLEMFIKYRYLVKHFSIKYMVDHHVLFYEKKIQIIKLKKLL